MMKRGIDDLNILEKFAVDFTKVVEKYAKYIIVSGFVAISHGRSRATEDIDMIIEKVSKEQFKKMHDELIESGFECQQSDNPNVIYDDYLNDKLSVRYTRKGEPLPEMKLSQAGFLSISKFPATDIHLAFVFCSISKTKALVAIVTIFNPIAS